MAIVNEVELHAEKLIALFENTDDEGGRVNYVRKISDLSLKTERVFKFFEDCLISDESYLVRTEAAKSLILTFKDESKVPILWAIQHEDSAFFFKTLLDLANRMGGSFSEVIKKQIFKRPSQIYELHEDDAKFLWDLDLHLLTFQNDNKIGLIRKYRMYHYAEKRGRVRTLNFVLNKLDHLPESIGLLKELRFLDISRNNLTMLPESMKNLKKLKRLNLNSNSFEKLPNWLADLPKLKQLNFSYNCIKEIPESIVKIAKKSYAPFHILEGLVPQEATVLGILDILLGFGRFVKIPRYERDLDEDAHCYNVNDDGHVTAILSWEHDDPGFGIFPEQLCELEYLEELYLNVHHIKTIPQSINKLKQLKLLDLSSNSIKKIPESITELKKLKILDLTDNPIIDIPESVIPFLKKLKRFDCDRDILMKFNLYDDKLPPKVKRIGLNF